MGGSERDSEHEQRGLQRSACLLSSCLPLSPCCQSASFARKSLGLARRKLLHPETPSAPSIRPSVHCRDGRRCAAARHRRGPPAAAAVAICSQSLERRCCSRPSVLISSLLSTAFIFSPHRRMLRLRRCSVRLKGSSGVCVRWQRRSRTCDSDKQRQCTSASLRLLLLQPNSSMRSCM